jgi:hypothetical protein
MAVAQERVKLRQGVKVEIGGKVVTQLRSVAGGGLLIPQVDTTSSGSKFQEFSTGRASYEPLKILFANAKDNTPIITQAAEYYLDPQNKPRQTIAVTEITRDGATAGAAITFYECFCTKMRLPTGNNQEGVLTTEMEWSIHRAEHGKGGVS